MLAIVVVLGTFAKNANALVKVFGHFVHNVLYDKELIQPEREFNTAHMYFLNSNQLLLAGIS